MKLSQTQFNELVCVGKLHFVNHDLYCISWLTYYEKVCLCKNVHTNEEELIKIEIEKEVRWWKN